MSSLYRLLPLLFLSDLVRGYHYDWAVAAIVICLLAAFAFAFALGVGIGIGIDIAAAAAAYSQLLRPYPAVYICCRARRHEQQAGLKVAAALQRLCPFGVFHNSAVPYAKVLW